MKHLTGILTASALCAITSVSFAGNINVINDTICHVNAAKGTATRGASVLLNSYTVDNVKHPTKLVLYGPINPNGPAPVLTDPSSGITGIIIGAGNGTYTAIIGAQNNDHIVYYTNPGSTDCTTRAPCYAAYDKDPCGSQAMNLGGAYQPRPFKKVQY